MIPLKLHLHNFMPYADAAIDFAGIHIGCIAGDNGAGKSALLDAITWAFWGRARSKRDDELVRQGATEMSVALTFELSGNVYQVLRTRKTGKRGGGALDLQVYGPLPGRPPSATGGEWRTLAESTYNQTQTKINELLRLDYDTFINSAFLLQGRADEFTVKTPAERKKVLADILGLQTWQSYEDRARKRAQDIETGLQAIDVRLHEIDLEIARRPQYEAEVASTQQAVIELGDTLRQVEARYQKVQQAQQELRHIEAQTAELANRARQAERELNAVLTELETARRKADATATRAELAAVRDQLERLLFRETERNEKRARRSELAEQSAALKGQNDRLGPETEPLKARLELLAAALDPTCPTCGQPLSPEHRQQVVAELQAEIAQRRDLYRSNVSRQRALAAEIATLDKELGVLDAELRGMNTLQRREAELNAALAAADDAQKSIARLEGRREQWQKTFDGDSMKQAEVAAKAAALRAELGDAEAILAEYERVRAEEARARQLLGAAEQKLAACEMLVKVRESKVAERNRLAEEKGIYEELRLAFSKKGVPAMIIEAAIPEIEDEANALLTRMTAGRMHVRFDTQKETVKGDTVETLDIQIADELGTRPYELFSGGEAFRINFTMRVALSKLLARRAGAQLQTLVIDEGFGALDAAGRERLVEAINTVQSDFERILVITHLDELKDAFPARIDVTKTEAGSQIVIT
ncbi:MAG TPA: SMC family ATPase [Anaerolineae bacterium]|nr:SMC family ATPase [Anaerolineae bacterium]